MALIGVTVSMKKITRQRSIGIITRSCADRNTYYPVSSNDVYRTMAAPKAYEDAPWHDEETLRELYHEQGMTLEEVGRTLGCSSWTVQNWMDRHGIERRAIGEHFGPGREHPRWSERATYTPDSDGYRYWSDHRQDGTDFVKVHRLLAVAEYGFDEVVEKEIHHKNGIPWDNRHDNIRPIDGEEHRRLHNAGESRKLYKDVHMMASLARDGKAPSDIAEQFGCHKNTVSKWMEKHDLPPNPWMARQIIGIKSKEGWGADRISQKLDVSVDTVHDWASLFSFDLPKSETSLNE